MSVPDFFTGTDVVVDCLDNNSARRNPATRCQKQTLALVHGAVNSWYGQIGMQLPGGNLLERLYPKQSRTTEPPPVLSFTPPLAACLQAAETVKLLIGVDRHNRSTAGSALTCCTGSLNILCNDLFNQY